MSSALEFDRFYRRPRARRSPDRESANFLRSFKNQADVISLGVGEPDFVTPWHIREAAIYALERGKTSYTSNLGCSSCARLSARSLETHFGLSYNPAKPDPDCRWRERSAGYRLAGPRQSGR